MERFRLCLCSCGWRDGVAENDTSVLLQCCLEGSDAYEANEFLVARGRVGGNHHGGRRCCNVVTTSGMRQGWLAHLRPGS